VAGGFPLYTGDFLERFEELGLEPDPFADYPIIHITPRD
jgi:hypothetical protein